MHMCAASKLMQAVECFEPVGLRQDTAAELVAVASSAADARVMLEALEAGTAGALLRTNDPEQARSGHSCRESWCCWLA